jgi:periplasmic protein TonB
MELKKSDKANLEKKKGLFFQIGLVVTLGIILIIFNWTARPPDDDDMFNVDEEVIEDEIIPITQMEPPEPPPPPEPPKVTEILEIVDDDIELEFDLSSLNFEDDRSTAMDIIDYDEEEDVDEDEIFMVVEEKPQFPGGEAKLMQYLRDNIEYPERARDNNIQGTVIVKFVVMETGNVAMAEIMRGVHPDLDKEALRVVRNMPKWSPGRQAGRAVKVYYMLPITFRLAE